MTYKKATQPTYWSLLSGHILKDWGVGVAQINHKFLLALKTSFVFKHYQLENETNQIHNCGKKLMWAFN